MSPLGYERKFRPPPRYVCLSPSFGRGRGGSRESVVDPIQKYVRFHFGQIAVLKLIAPHQCKFLGEHFRRWSEECERFIKGQRQLLNGLGQDIWQVRSSETAPCLYGVLIRLPPIHQDASTSYGLQSSTLQAGPLKDDFNLGLIIVSGQDCGDVTGV